MAGAVVASHSVGAVSVVRAVVNILNTLVNLDTQEVLSRSHSLESILALTLHVQAPLDELTLRVGDLAGLVASCTEVLISLGCILAITCVLALLKAIADEWMFTLTVVIARFVVTFGIFDTVVTSKTFIQISTVDSIANISFVTFA